MHGEDRNTYIHDIDRKAGNVFGHGTAAAKIHLAKLTGLPYHTGLIQYRADPAHKFG